MSEKMTPLFWGRKFLLVFLDFEPKKCFRVPTGGGGSPKGLVHNLLMQFFTLDSSKIEVFETCFSDIVIT